MISYRTQRTLVAVMGVILFVLLTALIYIGTIGEAKGTSIDQLFARKEFWEVFGALVMGMTAGIGAAITAVSGLQGKSFSPFAQFVCGFILGAGGGNIAAAFLASQLTATGMDITVAGMAVAAIISLFGVKILQFLNYLVDRLMKYGESAVDDATKNKKDE